MKAGIDYIGISTPFYCNDGQGKFILHRRSYKCRDEHGKWDFGGGGLEFGQTPEESVLREVLEEYGCQGEIQEQLPPYTVFREHESKRTHWIAIPFFILINPHEATINEPEAMDEIGWFQLNALPSPLHSAIPLAMDRYQIYFEKYHHR